MDLSNWKWKNICVFGIKRTCKRDRNWFALRSSNLSWVPYCISPRWIDISLLAITSNHLTGCEALLRCQRYRFIVKWMHCRIAYWAETSTAVECDSSLSGCPNQILQICVWRQQKFFSNYIPLWTCFSTMELFLNQTPIPNSTRRRHQVGVDDHRLLVRQTCETNSETRFSLKFVNGRWTEYAKTSVCIILVVLVYLESAKIYTGPRIVLVFTRLRNTELDIIHAHGIMYCVSLVSWESMGWDRKQCPMGQPLS